MKLGSQAKDCHIHETVPFSGILFQQMAGKVNATEACAALCAGSALQGCEAFVFCKPDETSHEVGLSIDFCMLLHTVQEVTNDRSPFPGRCTSGRACSSDCRDLDAQLPLVFPEAEASLTSSCSQLIYHQPGNCWSSWNDGKQEETTDPDMRLVQALCPESCRSCAYPSLQAQMPLGSHQNHATVAAAELARRVAIVAVTAECSIERGVAYQADMRGFLFKWQAVLNAETCASLCASSADCLAFTFYVADHEDFSKFDCVLHNSTSASTRGRRSDPCCNSGPACAARCSNQNQYVPDLWKVWFCFVTMLCHCRACTRPEVIVSCENASDVFLPYSADCCINPAIISSTPRYHC